MKTITAIGKGRNGAQIRYCFIAIFQPFGDERRETLTIVHDEFWATSSNKQLNFVQHMRPILKIGRSAVLVVPDKALFEGVAGELIRRRLLHDCDVHTLCACPRASSTRRA